MSRSTLAMASYALLAFLVIPIYPHFPSPNEFTRWLLVAAVVEHGTLEVSGVLPILGSRIEDLSLYEGAIYSNKAPGLAFVAAPGYLLSRPFAGPPARSNLRPVLYLMRWSGATLPVLLLMLAFRQAARRLGVEDAQIARGLVVLVFATPLFAYGLLLFSHALVAACLFSAWSFLYLSNGSPRRSGAAGVLIGLAIMSDYPAAVAALFLIAPLLRRRHLRTLAAVLAGTLPFTILLALYHHAAFGAVFRLPGQYELYPQFRELASRGLFGIQWPAPAHLGGLLFDASKGLFILSPILLMGLLSLRSAVRHLSRPAVFTLVAVPASIVLVYAGYPNWHGGWTVGARYLVPAIPFLVFPLLFEPWRPLTGWLCGWSVAAVTLSSLVFPFVPPAYPVPWGTFTMPLLREGLVIPNLLHWMAEPLAVLAPFLLVAAALAAVLARRQLLEAAGGIFIAVLLGLGSVGWITEGQELQRAYIEEVYFERPGAIDRVARGRTLSPQLIARRSAELAQPPVSWPF